MIVEKLKRVKRPKELVAFVAKLDDDIPHTRGKLCVCRESDGRMFYVTNVFIFDENPECQDPVILIIGDIDGYLKEGDDVSLVEEVLSKPSQQHYWGREVPRDFYTKHDIPGGWWRGAGGGMPETYPCSGYCQLCGKKCGKERHF